LVFGLALAGILGFALGLPFVVVTFPALLLLGVDPMVFDFSGDFDLFLEEDGGDLEATLVDLVGIREREFRRDSMPGGSTGFPLLETLLFWLKASGLMDFRRPIIIALAGLKEMDFRRLGVMDPLMLLFLAMVAGEMLEDLRDELMLSRELALEFPREVSKREFDLSKREWDLSKRELDLSKRELDLSKRFPTWSNREPGLEDGPLEAERESPPGLPLSLEGVLLGGTDLEGDLLLVWTFIPLEGDILMLALELLPEAVTPKSFRGELERDSGLLRIGMRERESLLVDTSDGVSAASPIKELLWVGLWAELLSLLGVPIMGDKVLGLAIFPCLLKGLEPPSRLS